VIRLFVALEMPETVRERLLTLQGGVPGARWAGDGQMHLTLASLAKSMRMSRTISTTRCRPSCAGL